MAPPCHAWLALLSAAAHLTIGVEAEPVAVLSTADPRGAFGTVNRANSTGQPGRAFEGRSAPLPTNAWWTNVVTAASAEAAEANIFQMPYVVLAGGAALKAMQPFATGTGGQDFDVSQAVSLGARESMNGPVVSGWDSMGVTLGWHGASRFAMTSPLVRGSPYITMEYTGATPDIASAQTARINITIDGKRGSCDGQAPLNGSDFGISFEESDSTWHVFVPKGVTWVCKSTPFSLRATGPVYGAVRLALANSCAQGTGARHCEGAPTGRDAAAYTALLAESAGRYPVNTSVGVEVEGDKGTVTWKWSTRSLDGWDLGTPLLQLAYPVHVPLMGSALRAASASQPATPFKDLRGPATAVLADTWSLTYDLFPDVGFRAPRSIDEAMRSALLAALKGPGGAMWNGSMPDKDFDLPRNFQVGAGDTYFSGKMLARLARLIVIADELGETTQPYFTQMVERLQARLEIWLTANRTANPLFYDESWGGMVACGCIYDDCHGECQPHCSNEVTPAEGCPAMHDAGMNFGNGFYNDHHFHYGYFVYGAAVLAKFSPAWEKKWREPLLTIIRDYGNPSGEDPFFPVVRHMDWFLGFSWAGGVGEAFRNGRNQESTSEAINSYYALYLYGASANAPFAQDLRNLGRVLTAMESHGADTFWHVRPNSAVYGTTYNHSVVGILWDHMAEYQTWFGGSPFMVHGIQQMPNTPVNELFLKEDWVSLALPSFKAACDGDATCQDGWSWIMCLEQAILDVPAARSCLQSLPPDAFSIANSGSNGNSLTNSLYWLATRPSRAQHESMVMI